MSEAEFAPYEILYRLRSNPEQLVWEHNDDQVEQINWYVDVSDAFPSGDSYEPVVTYGDLSMLDTARSNLEELNELSFLAGLYAATRRKKRPDQSFYEFILRDRKEIAALFNACGPELVAAE